LTRYINAEKFKAMIEHSQTILESRQDEINILNVFPVADCDTGTNMCVTLAAGSAALQNSNPKTLGSAAEIAAIAMLRMARGNSGVILALLFRGMAKKLKGCLQADAVSFAAALSEGVSSAYKSVENPVEGTILTVSRIVAAEAVQIAAKEYDIGIVLFRAIDAGYNELAKTIETNPILKKAGVVDAGAKCWLYLLEGMLSAISGRYNKKFDKIEEMIALNYVPTQNSEITFTYCTEFFAKKIKAVDLSPLWTFLRKIGDSLIFVEEESFIKVHIHTDDPDAVLREASVYVTRITSKIENMREQHTHKYIAAVK
jgi:DAK2 domain fusion protein YloV